MAKAAKERQSVAHALKWGVTGSLLKVALQLFSQVMLARLLGPQVYGGFVICALVIGLLVYLADAGLAYGLVYRDEISDADVGFVCAWQLCAGIALTMAACAGALLFGDGLADGTLGLPMAALSPVLLLTALAAPANNLLKRRMQFRAIQASQLYGHVLGYLLIGIPLALIGAGIWSLVAAWLVQAALSSLLAWRSAAWPWTPRWRHTEWKRFLSFAGVVTITNVVNWLVQNLDKLLVVKLQSAAGAGLYGLAFNLVNTPMSALNSAVQSVLFSEASRQRGDQAASKEVFLVAQASVVLVGMTLAGVLAALSTPLIETLYGKAWLETADYLVWFAAVIPITLTWSAITPILWNNGKLHSEFRVQVVVLLALLVFFWELGDVSLVTIIKVQVGVLTIRTVLVIAWVGSRLQVQWREWLRVVFAPLWIAVFTTVGCLASRMAVPEALGSLLHLLTGAVGAALAGGIALLVGARYLHPVVQGALRKASERLPAPVARLMGKALS